MELHDSKLAEAFVLKNKIHELMITLELRTRSLSAEDIDKLFTHILARPHEEHEITFIEACKAYHLAALAED